MLSRTTRRKLVAFLVVTTATLAMIGIKYMRLPEQLGIGVYDASLRLPSAAGLYPTAAVNYRGVRVGSVKGLEIVADGIVVKLALENGTPIPADVRAEVRSASAIGEQYVDLIPVNPQGGPVLASGSTITGGPESLPVSTTDLLTSVNDLVRSVPLKSLATTVDELYAGLGGSGAELGSILDSATALQDEASKNVQPTLRLVNTLVPVLQTQRAASGQIKSYTTDLQRLTAQLAADDDRIRSVLIKTAPLTDQLDGLYAELTPTLPVLLADLATTARVAEAYIPGIEHVLTVFPAVIAAVQGVVPASRFDDPITYGNLDFKTSLNDPPVCVEGFADAGKHRDPYDLAQVAPPTDSYCKVSRDDPRIVRGARNLPCPNSPARRGATAASCGLVFDRVTVPVPSNSPGVLRSYDRMTGLLLAPDGKRYRLADLADGARPPTTWLDLFLETTRP